MATTNGKRYGLADLVQAAGWMWRPVADAVRAETGLTPRQIVGGLLRAGAGLLWRAADTVAPVATPAVLIVTQPAAQPVAEVRPVEVAKPKAKRPAAAKPKAKPAAKKPTPKAKPVRAAARVTAKPKPKAKPKAAPKPRASRAKPKA